MSAAAMHNWEIDQIDIQTVFLKSQLDEEGLTQAARAWLL